LKVSVLGNCLDEKIELDYFLPRNNIDILICDNQPYGMQKIRKTS